MVKILANECGKYLVVVDKNALEHVSLNLEMPLPHSIYHIEFVLPAQKMLPLKILLVTDMMGAQNENPNTAQHINNT